ncbi:MAG: lysoplasmalogenase [Clostridia bacterium]|nr:lysoplasmalogenase [Clostridia bacterium]
MSPICLILAAVTIVFAFGCVTLRRKGRAFEGMLCKFMASFGFISIAVVGYCTNPVDTYYFCMMCFSVMFGFFGDVLLGIKEIAPTFKSKLVALGTLYFLAGHIFAICAFVSASGFSLPALITGIAGGIIALVMMKALKMKIDGKLRPVMAVYYAALFYKAASAAVLALETGKTEFIVAFIGAVLFVISDTCLGILYFTPVKRKNIWVTLELSTYYPAQILLAMSVALMK